MIFRNGNIMKDHEALRKKKNTMKRSIKQEEIWKR